MNVESLVLVPGLLCTQELFAPQIAALASQADIRVADHTRHTSMAEIAAGILATAPARFALAGLSMGGYIAQEMMRQAPSRITRLALLDTNSRADRPEQTEQRRALMSLAEKEGSTAGVTEQLLPYLIHKDRLSDAPLVAIIRRMSLDTGVAAFKRQQAAIMARPEYRPFLKDIRCPTLVIVGAEDALTPVKVHEEIAAGIAGAQLEVIPSCGHLTTLEKPEAVIRMMKDWLSNPGPGDG